MKIYLLFFLFAFKVLDGQDFQIGETYADPNGFVEYTYGNLPLIISIPHGGELRPTTIPDRTCNACVTINDAFTQELGIAVVDAIVKESGCFPHLVVNKLHRSKMDANRAIAEAADGDSLAELAWMAYTDFIAVATDSLNAFYDRGLFLDLHGHAHTKQRLELGYLLSREDLQLDNEALDQLEFVSKSSIRNLVMTNEEGHPLSQLLRGERSFGEQLVSRGVPAVPSLSDPYPESNDAYFTGGYNTVQYGSRTGGTIDAIQIECNQDVRFDADRRNAFAETLAIAIKEFLILYYGADVGTVSCFVLDTEDVSQESFSLFPNPARTQFNIDSPSSSYRVTIHDFLGKCLRSYPKNEYNYDISDLPAGNYVVTLLGNDIYSSKKLSVIR